MLRPLRAVPEQLDDSQISRPEIQFGIQEITNMIQKALIL